MTKKDVLAIKRDRLARLTSSVKNVKCPGVCRKLRREIRNLEA